MVISKRTAKRWIALGRAREVGAVIGENGWLWMTVENMHLQITAHYRIKRV